MRILIHVINCYYIHIHLRHTHEPQIEISNNVVCATSKSSDQPAHTRSLIREYSMTVKLLTEHRVSSQVINIHAVLELIA